MSQGGALLRPPSRAWSRRTAWAVATWFGCGLVPLAPGTAGTLGAVPLYLLSLHVAGRPGVAAAAVLVVAVGLWAASLVGRELKQKDPQIVVVDEVAGFLVTMLPVQHVSSGALIAGFVVFRLLDVTKPWPTRKLERLPGGWGIVLDDVAAGAFGAGVMILLFALGVIH